MSICVSVYGHSCGGGGCGCVNDSNCGSVMILIGSIVYIVGCVFCRSNYLAKWPSKIDFLRHIPSPEC